MRWFGIAILALYSGFLLYVEASGTQQDVRPYVSDITGHAVFGLNTTLDAFLLWSCALVFALALMLGSRVGLPGKTRLFYVSQVLVFLYLGLDERFLLHEQIGDKFYIHDSWPLLTVAAAEGMLILCCGNLMQRSGRTRLYLVIGVGFFLLMLGIDRFAAADARMRLSTEDLSKTWGSTFLFFYALEHLLAEADRLQTSCEPG